VGEPVVSGRIVRVAPDAPALMRLAAGEVVRRSEAALAARGRFAIALSGGTTPEGLYALLAEPAEPFRARVRWESTHVFFGDERHVPPDHPDSNYRMARATLLGKVPIPPENVHRMRAELDAPTAAREYEAELLRVLGAGPEGPARGLPRLDLVLLGLGADGHTASLFPGSEALAERARLAVAPWVEHLHSHRITLTLPALGAARAIAFMVSGTGKASRVADVLEGPGASLPAGRVRPLDGDLLWLVDAPAAALLRGPVERTA
jgi:6-phosphogluconolactonase